MNAEANISLKLVLAQVSKFCRVHFKFSSPIDNLVFMGNTVLFLPRLEVYQALFLFNYKVSHGKVLFGIKIK